ncbi:MULTISPECIES: hypothetical protein [unclassified Granulicatella]|uniref:hypothetical protein n=1 Tax=unclassified Granulicatella TaxID=2630493 RepID=UPI0010738160|nr:MULTISPECIES: hypothetical protein [unclassified Granulicatella]MBF0780808.1 hypothetical protein [Granulicatella sp. 19428wC4_WM01]TFU93824.1 hypothetical protein E4T68_06820 [Granulicatella sp. WM01]
MKKIIMLTVCLLVFIHLCACSSTHTSQNEIEEDVEHSALYSTKRIKNSDYTYKEINIPDLQIKKAAGLASDSEYLYVSDVENASINCYDRQFKLVKRIQIPELSAPSLLYKTDTALYVINKQTNTLVVLSHDFSKVLHSIVLPQKESGSRYIDLEVLNDLVYITLNTPWSNDAKIIEVNMLEKQIKQLDSAFVGFIYAAKEQLYAINSLEPYKTNEKTGFQGGQNSLFLLSQSQLVKKGELISKSYPGDFIYTNEFLYVYTAGWSSIDRYDKQFNYIDSIAMFSNSDIESVVSGQDNHLFLLMPNDQKLYEVIRK